MRISVTFLTLVIGGLVLLVGVPPAAKAENVVANGTFDSGLAGWTTQSNPDNAPSSWSAVSNVTDSISLPCCHDTETLAPDAGSTFFATTGCNNFQPCLLEQDIPTVAGAFYNISFAFNPGYFVSSVFPGSGETVVYFGSTELEDLSNGSEGWTDYTVDNVQAIGDLTTLSFSGYQNPAHNGLDSVIVDGPAQTPEPASIVLIAIGFLGVGLRRYWNTHARV